MGTTAALSRAFLVKNKYNGSIINVGTNSNGKSFGILFIIMWGGAIVVTINTKLLGGHISFFQCVCVLGYCTLPIVLAAAAIYILKLVKVDFLIVKMIIAALAIVWAMLSK